jgi:hypothetical protein
MIWGCEKNASHFSYFKSSNTYRHKKDISCQVLMGLTCLQYSLYDEYYLLGTFRRNVLPLSSGSESKPSKNPECIRQHLLAAGVLLVSFLTYSSNPKIEVARSPETSVALCITSQKTVVLIVTAVRTSDPTHTKSRFQVFHRSSKLKRKICSCA